MCWLSDCIAFRARRRDTLTVVFTGRTISRQAEKNNQGIYKHMALVGLLEDNAGIAKMSATMLHYRGHQVAVYACARECLQALSVLDTCLDGRLSSMHSRLPLDVLVLDLHLPDIDGVEVLLRLRSHPRTRSLPLIFCTAATSAEVARAMKIAPHAGLVRKPFHLDELSEAITSALVTVSK